ncbi:hypothetical protein [Nonomuraea sp. NPDC049607]
MAYDVGGGLAQDSGRQRVGLGRQRPEYNTRDGQEGDWLHPQ